MTYTITYNSSEKTFEIETQGDFDVAVFKSLAAELLHHQQWQPGSNCIFDYRKTDFMQVDLKEFQAVSNLHQVNNALVGSGKSAFVMKSRSNFGMGRMYESITSPHVDTEFKIFTDIADARAWIKSAG